MRGVASPVTGPGGPVRVHGVHQAVVFVGRDGYRPAIKEAHKPMPFNGGEPRGGYE